VTAVHQFVPALLPRDATGDHTLALQDALRSVGWESDIYVEAAHDDLWHRASYFERYPERARSGDILLYQLSTASPVAEFLLERPETLVLDYHNVTPSSFYDGWEDHTSEKVALARVQASKLARRATLGIADSAFNAEELRHMGCRATAVASILVDIDDVGPRADVATLDGLARAHGETTVLLFVGRVSPNKAQHHLVEALWLYRRWYDPDARLHLVGPPVTPSYLQAVMELAAELGLTEVVTHHHDLSDAELAAFYEDADVFVCLSEHEGFCIPLLEAMRSGLPIVAYAAGAVPETLGPAGLLLKTKRPSEVAAAIARVRGDGELAGHLTTAGHHRLGEFAQDGVRARFVEVLGSVAQGRSLVP
jgi:glycosyltransferase involved in cell wall biosynthesis